MRRTIVYLIALIAIAGAAQAQSGPYYKKLGQRLMIPVNLALDSAGIPKVPDSITVTTIRDDATAATAYRNWTYTNALATTGWFDTTLNGGFPVLVMNVWSDSIGGATPTGRMVAVNVKTFVKLIPYETIFSVYITASDIPQLLARIDTTLSWALQNYINVSKIGGQTASASGTITFPNGTLSTLTAADNVGINWGDISNVTSTNSLTNTTVGTATNISQIGGTAQTGINLGAYLPAAFDTVLIFNGMRTGCKAKFRTSTASDTLYIYSTNGSTLLQRTVYYHPGGAAGDPPNDTSKAVGP